MVRFVWFLLTRIVLIAAIIALIAATIGYALYWLLT